MPGFAWRREKPGVMPRAREYPVELLERGTRLVFESGRPVAHGAADLGLPSEMLRKYVRQVEANEGRRADLLTSEEREEIRKKAHGGVSGSVIFSGVTTYVSNSTPAAGGA